MIITSKFKTAAYLPIIAFVFYILVTFFIYYFPGIFLNMPKVLVIIVTIYTLAIIIKLFLIEGLLKINTLQINSREVIVKKAWGFLNEKKYRLKDLDGYYTSTKQLRRKQQTFTYNYLLIMQKGKIVAHISNQYHQNFNEMNDFIKENLTDLGYKKSTIFLDIKNALKF